MSKRKLALSAVLAAAALAFAGQAMAMPMSYTASSTMTPATFTGANWSLAALSNGDTTPMDGFATNSATGKITLDLERCGSLKSFTIYNNINGTTNGVKTFTLKFYGQNGTLLGTQTGSINNGAAPQTIGVPGGTLMQFVHSVEMNITASFDSRIEIREIVLDGTPGTCCP